MASGRGRKGIKRPERRARAADHDDELAELASVIAEYSLDNNAGGWFRPAWRDGWNAVGLALAACDLAAFDAEAMFLRGVCHQRVATNEIYETASDLWATTHDKMARAALRCLQVLIAKSDGGGEVYNAILTKPFSEELPEDVFDLVLEYRCHDSIGTTAVLQGDLNDRQRRAFSIAWKRGLYLAAYSLPPAIRPEASKLTVWKEPK